MTIPGGGGTFNFSVGDNDGDGPVFVYQWSPSKKLASAEDDGRLTPHVDTMATPAVPGAP